MGYFPGVCIENLMRNGQKPYADVVLGVLHIYLHPHNWIREPLYLFTSRNNVEVLISRDSWLEIYGVLSSY